MACSGKFAEHGCVPDVVDIAPPIQAQVSYSSGVKADCGNVLTPTNVKDAPTVTWPTEEGALYTLILTDPDAPSRSDNKWSEWRHWLVVNITGNDINNGQVLSDYIGSGPPEGTGLHRYIFLIYKQPGLLQCDELHQGFSPKGRNNTKAKDFATKYNLGNPIAGNFYQAEWDDYVPVLYSKMK